MGLNLMNQTHYIFNPEIQSCKPNRVLKIKQCKIKFLKQIISKEVSDVKNAWVYVYYYEVITHNYMK